jgi:predicted hydrocarbon binding protein
VNGAAFLFETGLVIGSTFGEEFMAHPAEPDALVRRLCELTTAAGWGTFAMIGDTKYGTQLNVVVANCIFCEGTNALEEPACEILAGAIKGITDKVYGVPHRVFENRCIAMKDNICQVVVMEDDDYQIGGRPPVAMKERDGSFEDAQSDVVQKGGPPARFYPVRREDLASRSEWPKA